MYTHIDSSNPNTALSFNLFFNSFLLTEEKEEVTGQANNEQEKSKDNFINKLTAGKAKKEMPRRAQPEAIIFPGQVSGVLSP